MSGSRYFNLMTYKLIKDCKLDPVDEEYVLHCRQSLNIFGELSLRQELFLRALIREMYPRPAN